MSKIFKPPRGAVLNTTHPLARGLVGCWLMNEGTGRRIFDYSGNKNHGLMTNMDPATDWKAGPHGWAVEFADTGQNIVVNAMHFNFNNGYTISTFIRADVLPTGDWETDTYIDCWADIDNAIYMRTQRYNTNTWAINCVAEYGGVTHSTNTTFVASPIFYQQYVHVVLCWNLQSQKVYINGIEAGTTSAVGVSFSNNMGLRLIGAGGSVLNGIVGNALIYNRALSVPEIAWLYESPYSMFGLDIRSSYFPEPSPPVIIRPQKPKVYVFGGLYIKNTGTGSSLKVAVA